jgi:hypothetical protein
MVVIISVQAKVREFNYLFDGFFSEEGCYSIDTNSRETYFYWCSCQFGSCNQYLLLVVPSYLHRIYCNSAS